ncbi:MAG: Mth938-like domain-containing protein [Rhodoferax sp.]
MKLLPDAASGYSIQSHGDGWVRVQGQRFAHSLLISSEHGVHDWEPASFDQLRAAHFEPLLPWRPEVLLLGSGQRLRFAPASMLASLYQAGIGVETMDTAAACRTFNFLVAEGRRVVAALLVEPGKPS